MSESQQPHHPSRLKAIIAEATTLLPAFSGTAAGPLLRKIANLSAPHAPRTTTKLIDWDTDSLAWTVEIEHDPPGASGPILTLVPPHEDPDPSSNQSLIIWFELDAGKPKLMIAPVDGIRLATVWLRPDRLLLDIPAGTTAIIDHTGVLAVYEESRAFEVFNAT